MRRFFQLDSLHTTIGKEIIGGVTTFMTMAYIVVVNPQILSAAGMPFDSVLFATCVAAAIASTIMGLWARYPIALAPGMGLNAYFAFTVVPQLAKTVGSQEQAWAAALGAVFCSGALFLLLSLVRLREVIVDAVPSSLKLSISAGIGLFIALIGFQHGGLIQAHPVTLLSVGALASAKPLLTLGGLIVTGGLMARGLPGAAIIGIVITALGAMLCGLAAPPTAIIAMPKPGATFFALNIPAALSSGLLNVIFAFFFVDLFDTIGTLIGVAQQAGFVDAAGKIPRVSRALLADAIGTVVGALLGTSTVTSYIESASGISAGARSGLASLVTAGLFLLALPFAPLLRAIPPVATAPVLILVGALMASSLKEIDWQDLSTSVPAFLTFCGIAFSFSIADGMALGFVSHALLALVSGRARGLPPMMWLLALLFALRYTLLG